MISRLTKNIFFVTILLCSHCAIQARTTLTRNDYLPLYTTMDPQTFLLDRTKDILMDRPVDGDREKDHFSFYLTPFGQNANVGRDFDNHYFPDCSCNDCDSATDPEESHLGSLNARWSMIGLLMGEVPTGKEYGTILQAARNELFGITSSTETFTYSDAIDCEKNFGFFQFPACYRKRGLRFQMAAGITDDFGVIIEGGVSSINFNVCMDCDNNLTNAEPASGSCLALAAAEYTNLTKDNVNEYLMCRLSDIAKELNRDLCDFHDTSIEDIRAGVYWRRPIEVNEDREGWPKFLFIPFLSLGFSIGAAKEQCPLAPFALPFGNNGHSAFWAYGGTNIDFTETIEIGWEAGFTKFFDNSFDNYPMPTYELQRGIFPFTTKVTVSPGTNWHFGLKMNARHFLDRLSFYFQWVVMEHKKDHFCIKSQNNPVSSCGGCGGISSNVFKPEVLTCRSAWKAQVINTALNYDISPNVALGFAWQAPISQRNVFRSTTVAFGLNLTF